jgi:N-acetylneuraminate epimerase
VGVLPFSRATTGTAEWRGQVVVPMGEARPRERTPDVWWAKLPNSPVAKTGAR